MPRRQFIADVQQASQEHGVVGVHDVRTGDDDGQVDFLFSHGQLERPVSVTASVGDVSDYPKHHDYFIYTAGDTPKELTAAFGALPRTQDKTVGEMLDIIATYLSKQLTDSDGDVHMADDELDYEDPDEEEEDDYHGSEDEEGFGTPTRSLTAAAANPGAFGVSSAGFRARIRADLRAAKAAGFKVGHQGPLMDATNAYVSVACRMSKLGISEEAMQAWQVDGSDYLILLIQYPAGYKTNEQLQGHDGGNSSRNVVMRVGASKHYKPTLQQAINAFSAAGDFKDLTKNENDKGSFRSIFISAPLNELLNERLIQLLRYRATGISWEGAEQFFIGLQGTSLGAVSAIDDKYLGIEDPASAVLPPIALADPMTDSGASEHSFPLLAMLYLLRHFVRCTDYCLVCHRRVPGDLEAIKPYVCDEPLCLYQYMSLGFGPSIEHEILSQPNVADLLISFCYNSAVSGKLKDFPNGLGFSVPASFLQDDDWQQFKPGVTPWTRKNSTLRYDASSGDIVFDDPPSKCPLQTSDWIQLDLAENPALVFHCRVMETCLFPTVRVGPLIPATRTDLPGPQDVASKTVVSEGGIQSGILHDPTEKFGAAPQWHDAAIEVYDRNFDDLEVHEKRTCVSHLLRLLPSVKEMCQYLNQRATGTPELRRWKDRIPQAALAVLRWVIASNRACIMQVDYNNEDAETQTKTKHRLYGMQGWVQFRFAMGAPDKEQRFLTAVRETSSRLALQYPTLFAWHGSPFYNWHAIIREGLHFEQTAHGRAYGNGCYHSLNHDTSLGYTHGYSTYSHKGSGFWPQSALKADIAMSLNEIVNAPNEFISKSPHLVVAQLDWIQTRYLFVKSRMDAVTASVIEEWPANALPQDPSMTPRGSTGQIRIPAKASKARATSKRKVTSPKKQSKGSKKAKRFFQKNKGNGTVDDPISIDDDDDDFQADVEDDAQSVETDIEDVVLLLDDEPEQDPVKKDSPAALPDPKSKASKTDFIPGTLDHSTLPQLPEPDYATPAATKRLQSDFRALLKVQQTTPLEELGWYIDPSKLDNVYHWIVELHSFHIFETADGKPIPLSVDMKKAGVKSIVCEIRFPSRYPFDPPFVRVVRPRFLSFMQGGGGHVTAGGAMCMELLTNTGWSAVSSIESVLLQVRLAIASTDPKPARLEHGSRGDYGVGEAVDAYVRACRMHGWTIPPEFEKMRYGGGGGL